MIIKELQFGISNHGKTHAIFCNKERTYLWGVGSEGKSSNYSSFSLIAL